MIQSPTRGDIMRDTLIEKKNQTFLPDEMKTFSRKQKQQSFAIK